MLQDRRCIDVVMVVYNRKNIVFESLPTLIKCPLIDRIILVDNGSSDNINIEGPERFPEVRWLFLDKNEGCTAWNKGMKETRSPLALILDDDCVPDIPSVYAAAEKMGKEEHVGLAVFNIINQSSGKSEWRTLEKLDGSAGWANAIGACMLVRVNSFLDVGGYKDYFLCFNDLDLVLSLWEAGYSVIYNENWKAAHKQKVFGNKKRRLFHEVRNLLWTSWGHLKFIPSSLITLKFIMGALYDARGIKESSLVIKAVKHGIELGLKERRKRKGEIPKHVLRLLYRNFLFNCRLFNREIRV